MSTCRLCGDSKEPLFKYSVRHYAHADCAFVQWGAKFLDMIPQHQIGRLPWRVLDTFHLLPEAQRRMKELA